MFPSLSAAVTVPTSFEIRHERREEIAAARLRELRRAVLRLEQAEALDLGPDAEDARPKFRALGQRLSDLKDPASVKTVQRLLVDCVH